MIDPVAFSIFGTEIRWYGISYIIGILIGERIARHFLYLTSLKDKHIDKFINFMIISLAIGARVGHFLFYEPTIFTKEIFFIRNGGMSFHGALFGIWFSAIFFSYKNKINFYELSALIAIAAPFGIGIGRITNFLNQDIIPRNIALYEAFLEGLVLQIIMLYYAKNNKNIKQIGPLFLINYSIFRIFMEFFKQPEALICGINSAIILSCFTLFIGNFLFIKNHK